MSGELHDRFSPVTWPIEGGIPRFVRDEGYASNFGLQWTTFRLTQFDSYTGKPLFFDRFWKNTKWDAAELRGARVLEVGSGAGSFTEVLLEAGARVVSVDLSLAVEANLASNGEKGDLFVMQADLHDIPAPDEYFDFVFCYGVLQHTPQPERAYKALLKKVRPGGRLSLDCYLRTDRLDPWSTPKYAWRRWTTRMRPEALLRVIKLYMPWWLPIDTLIRRIPKVGPKIVAFLRVPCWNHLELELPRRERQRWAVMNTFDALGARFDYPMTLEEISRMIDRHPYASKEVFYGSNGVVANVLIPAPD